MKTNSLYPESTHLLIPAAENVSCYNINIIDGFHKCH